MFIYIHHAVTPINKQKNVAIPNFKIDNDKKINECRDTNITEEESAKNNIKI